MTFRRDLIAEVPEAFVRLSERDRVMSLPSLRGELSTGPIETLEARTAIAALTGLVFAAKRASEAARNAISWRNYRVGATAVMVDFASGRLGYLDGYNVKPRDGMDGINLHAEQIAVAKGRRHGLSRLVAMAVCADPEDPNANPLSLPTLRPCNRCIDMLVATPEADERTLILGVSPDFSQCEVYTFGSLTDADRPNSTLTQVPFALNTEGDLDIYDRLTQPQLIPAINAMYTQAVLTP